MRITLLLTFTLVAGAAWAQDAGLKPAAAPTWQVDARWGSWVGCWRAEDDFDSTGVRLCIVPEGVPGVKMLTLAGTELRSTEIVIPDRVTRPMADADCRGTSRSEWSRNGVRLFRYTDVTCGTAPAQKLSGLTFLTEGPVLVDVQFADVPDNKSVRVRRYRRAANHMLPDGGVAPRAADTSGSAIGAAWTVADVIEATGKIPGDAVQAALTEAGNGFRLNKASLIAMANAGVPDYVIDLMVALSFPKRFIVDRRQPVATDAGFMGPDIGWWDPFFMPLMSYSLMNYPCSPFSFGTMGCGPYYSAYRYGPYGYNYYYPYSSYYGGWVVVDSGSSVGSVPGTPAEPVASGEGRVINGRGYTQIRNREPVPVPGRGNSGSSGGSSGDTSSGTNSTGSSGVSSGGYSGGGSSGGGDSGRTAVPRPPGGL